MATKLSSTNGLLPYEIFYLKFFSFIRQLLLVPLDMSKKGFEFCQIHWWFRTFEIGSLVCSPLKVDKIVFEELAGAKYTEE